MCLVNMRMILITLVFFSVASCTKIRIDPDCYPKNQIEHEANNWQGRVIYFDELGQWTIRHHVPGTIDSFYTSVVCNMPDEYKIDQLEVIFSGYLKDDKGKINPSTIIGGEEFFFLDLIDISLEE